MPLPWITALAALAIGGVALGGARGMLPMRPRSARATGWMSVAMAVMAAAAMLWPPVVPALRAGARAAGFLLPFVLGLYFTATSARAAPLSPASRWVRWL